MYKVQTVWATIEERGIVFLIESPVSCARSKEALSNAIGSEIDINGCVYRPIKYEFHVPATDISKGEEIAVLVGDLDS